MLPSLIPNLRALSTTVTVESLRAILFALARIASALELGAVGRFLRSVESKLEVEVAGEGVCDGVQGEGGPMGNPCELVDKISGLSLITWVTALERHSSMC